ncbi:DUF1707 domain-containing protein [Streptomyces bobili]|uniref:DUF1707 SHOCT-like domain-containing protein n=1 Tax=Streptomyces bobili TaxID=67280 RepID=UPI002250972C|nr:DUF1707 domain-containing protein [Streptomyces bobili]MCX5521995.1 DUF1707 domain-containing protein [Streptomyces bobili]
MTSVSEDPPSPIGEDDRDPAVRRLQEAYAEGHISHQEMDEGLDRLLTAEGRGDLESVLDSLPAQKPGSTSTIAAAGGRIRRGGSWRVPRILSIRRTSRAGTDSVPEGISEGSGRYPSVAKRSRTARVHSGKDNTARPYPQSSPPQPGGTRPAHL